MANIEIVGVERLRMALSGLPSEVRPIVLRAVATKPAQRAAAIARRMQPIGETGATARTIGIRKVRNANQPFVEVNYKGRSLGYIYTSAERIARQGRGVLKGFPNLFHKAGDVVRATAQREMKIDLTSILVRGMRKYGYS